MFVYELMSMCNTNVKEFEKFHELIKDYNPYYMVVSPRSKIRNKKFKKETFEEVSSMMERGYNAALLANETSPLVILDIDYPDKMTPYPETLKCISGSRKGYHLVYITNDRIENYPGPAGELRAINQYIITPGSYVPNEKNTGNYFIEHAIKPTEITLETLPEAFVRPPQETIVTPTSATQNDGVYQMGRTALDWLTPEDILGHHVGNFESPIHGSKNGKNTRIKDGLIYCYRCQTYHTAVTYLAAWSGQIGCEDGFKFRGDKKINKPINENELFVWARVNGKIPEVK